jgi:hypothetical protein
MRIIKLSSNPKVEDDFKTRAMVDTCFLERLPNPERQGRFFLPKSAIGIDGISPGEKLVFTYKGECVYRALADSARMRNDDRDKRKYPYYFAVKVDSIEAIQGTLPELQQKLEQAGLAINLVKSRKWLRFPDNGPAGQIIDAFVTPAHSNPINVEDEELTDDEIDRAIRANRLRIGIVATDTQQAKIRQRKGQARIRKLTIEDYRGCCAACDVKDLALLVASHIVPWAEAPEHRGDLRNVICLCRIHDSLFETGYWSLGKDLKLLKKNSITSKTIRHLLDEMTSFRLPLAFPPAPRFVNRHREKSGFMI